MVRRQGSGLPGSDPHLSDLRAAAIALVVAGCSGIPAYTSSLPKNLTIVTEIDPGGRFTATQAALDVHRVNTRCETEYRGRVNLEKGALQIGIPEERLFLDFIFVSKGTFSGSGATRYSTMLVARPGHEYRAHVTYDKGIYDVQLRELRKGSSQSRAVEAVPLSGCKAS